MVRLDRIATRTGDDGTTGMGDGRRLSKDHPLVATLGTVDEANAILGLVRLEALPAAVAAEVARVQNDLFDLGGDLCLPRGGPYEAHLRRIGDGHLARLDAALAVANAGLPPLTSFVLPGGTRAAATLHHARTVVRRAERELVAALAHGDPAGLNPACLRYLNRLSDCCFVWARRCNDDGRVDVAWVPGANA